MTSRTAFKILFVFAFTTRLFGQMFDIVIAHGRVIDPESGMDNVRNVGITDGRIEAISAEPLRGKQTLDAHGLVVAPGFIDLHSHGQTDENYRLKAQDGVTTALELEVGANPISQWYRERDGEALINFGASSGHIAARMQVLHDSGTFLPRDRAIATRASPAEKATILALVKHGLEEGGLGVGLGIAYTPGVTRSEILELFQLAATGHVACYVHMRNPGPVEPGVIDSMQEVLADAAVTGASLHIVHLPSMAFRQTSYCLEMIKSARKHGLDVTTEAYPYTAGMTRLETAIFDEGWQERLGIGFADLQWVATGERLTPESFLRLRKTGGDVILHHMPEDVVRATVADPSVIIASDGWVTNGQGHPRASGTYARMLAKYVRDDHALTLTEAVRKMSLAPAQRLESVSAQMKQKGRVQVGADADLVVFDPATVQDRATYEHPAVPSVGFRYVLVNGRAVISEGKLVEGTFPGVGIRASSGK